MYENEEQSDIIGKSCTLLTPYKGYTEGTAVSYTHLTLPTNSRV